MHLQADPAGGIRHESVPFLRAEDVEVGPDRIYRRFVIELIARGHQCLFCFEICDDGTRDCSATLLSLTYHEGGDAAKQVGERGRRRGTKASDGAK
jgi:hypothetical protein